MGPAHTASTRSPNIPRSFDRPNKAIMRRGEFEFCLKILVGELLELVPIWLPRHHTRGGAGTFAYPPLP